ncbi:MAG: hypothetical protein KAU17_11880 [Spirochaetales bacterium]|nr:hypothetical protein [Spirochaetales bacterium]
MKNTLNYYLWDYEIDDSIPLYTCGIEQFDGWDKIGFNSGREIKVNLPEVLKYYSDNKSPPPDFPRANSSRYMLVSDKIASILRDYNVTGIDYYLSEIIHDDGSRFAPYYTINCGYFSDCVNYDASEYLMKRYVSTEIPVFRHLVLDQSKIPENWLLFRFIRNKNLLFIHEEIVKKLKDAGVTGTRFVPVDEFWEPGSRRRH